MSIHFSVDRFEGDGKKVAVLLTDAGDSIDFPKALLPKGTKPGDVLTFRIEKDADATRSVADETARLQGELSEGDAGGDLKL